MLTEEHWSDLVDQTARWLAVPQPFTDIKERM